MADTEIKAPEDNTKDIVLNPGNGEIETQYNWKNIIIQKGAFYVIKTENDDFWKSVENKFLFDTGENEQVHYFGIQNDSLNNPDPVYYAGVYDISSGTYISCIRFVDNKKAGVKDYFSLDNNAVIMEIHPPNSPGANKEAQKFDDMIATAHPASRETF